MKKLLGILFIMILPSCGFHDKDNANRLAYAARLHYMTPDMRHKGVDKEFAKYVFIFEKYWDNNVNDVPINFGQVDDDAAAVCEFMLDGRKQIIVKKDDWEEHKSMNDHAYLEMIIFHELGHCVLSRDHRDKISEFLDQNGKPYEDSASMMHPSGVEYGYEFHREYYISELFRRSIKPDPNDIKWYRSQDEKGR